MASSTPLAFEPPSTLSVHQGLLPSTNRRDWAYHIGSLTAKDRIVFSKESLIGFLKVHGIDVGPNCTELSALPRFSVVGKFNESATPAAASSAAPEISSLSINDSSLEAPRPAPSAPTSTTSQRTSDSNPQSQQAAFQEPGLTRGIVVDRTDASGEAWKPTRRVREAIGGGSAQIGALFGGDEHDDDQALKDAEAQVRARRLGSNNENTTSQPQTHVNKEPIRQAQPQPQQGGEKWKPTRRVREDVGGGSAQIGALFGGDEDEDALREAEAAVRARRGGGGVQPPAQDHQPQKFIPSRRVREPGGTGGASSITFD